MPARFWNKTNRGSECWEWTGYIDSGTGYGKFYWGEGESKRPRWAHRVAWFLTHGAIPDGLFVLHRCDNRRCVRPDHLFLGTNQENMIDASVKGRLKNRKRPQRKEQWAGEVGNARKVLVLVGPAELVERAS